MRTFNSARLTEKAMQNLTGDQTSWVYNGLDCCVTFEIFETLMEEVMDSPEYVQRTYSFAMHKHGAILDMSMRGLRINKAQITRTINDLQKELDHIEGNFNRILLEVFEITDLNWKSPTQLIELFYNVMKIKAIRKRNTKGFFTPTVGRKALEKIQTNFYAKPIVMHILALRDLGKSIGFLKTESDGDGRMRTGFNIAGTKTGRLASRENEFGTGTNLQNVTEKLRSVFIADPGMLLVNVDLEQADARNIGALLWEIYYETKGPERAGKYLDACESGDLHTTVCGMAWRDLDWGDDPAGWRAVADQLAYRGKSYRDMAKVLGHGTNYYGQARTMAGHTQTDVRLIEAFQKEYFGAFPLIAEWHKWVENELKTTGFLVTPFGRRRHFFNRVSEPATLREAIAYAPQSMTAEEIDQGYVNMWREEPRCELLLQVHDSILFQVPFKDHKELIPKALELLRVEHVLKGGRIFSVPLEAMCGWNWGYGGEANPHGLMNWTGEETRRSPIPSLVTKRRSLKEALAS